MARRKQSTFHFNPGDKRARMSRLVNGRSHILRRGRFTRPLV
jgi:hypothetical protein